MIPRTDPSRPLVFASPASPEARAGSGEALIDALYRQVLKRPADAAGLRHYAEQLQAGTSSAKEITRDLMLSDEWAARFIHGRSIHETVFALYDCALTRAPDVDGWNQLTSWEPQNGWAAVIDRMLDCAEYDARFGTDDVSTSSK